MPDAPSRPRTRSLIAALRGRGRRCGAGQWRRAGRRARPSSHRRPRLRAAERDRVGRRHRHVDQHRRRQTHTATADDGILGRGEHRPATAALGAVVYTTAGSFAYHCTIHPTDDRHRRRRGGRRSGRRVVQPTDTAPIGATGSGGDRTLAAIVMRCSPLPSGRRCCSGVRPAPRSCGPARGGRRRRTCECAELRAARPIRRAAGERSRSPSSSSRSLRQSRWPSSGGSSTCRG